MGVVQLELRCSPGVYGIKVDPDPDWNFDSLVSELNSLERKFNALPVPVTKAKTRDFPSAKNSAGRNSGPFVMRVFEDEVGDSDTDDDEEVHGPSLVVSTNCFGFDRLYLSDSDDSSNGLDSQAQSLLVAGMGSAEVALLDLNREYHLGVQEDIRNQISVLETDLISETQKSTSAFIRVERYQEARREMDKKLDTQYQRKIAEALDNHLTAVQRDHELRSQIEERKIRSDAAFEEAKRKEKALQEEKLRQEKAKAKAEAEAKLRAEEAKRASEEAEKRAAEQAAEKEVAEISNKSESGLVQGETVRKGSLTAQPSTSASGGRKPSKSAGNLVKAAESALTLERARLQKLKELDEQNQALKLNLNEEFSSYERRFSRWISSIRGTKENVSARANEIMKILTDPLCPQSISISAFAKKVVSRCESPDNDHFACAHVIVLVTSQFPQAVDLILAELHRACIYTVPKHLAYSKSVFESQGAYYKALGFREIERKQESLKEFLDRIASYMKLYGALVQTEIPGLQNTHGLKEGWAWLARFLNSCPPNIFTAYALNAFLQTAGYALFRRYKSQFMKILNIVSGHFLEKLKGREDAGINMIIAELQSYLADGKYLKEPKGRSLQDSLLSTARAPDSNYQEPYSQSANRYNFY